MVANDGDHVEVKPDLRGGRDWFYWYFEAEASEPGEVTFQFNGKKVGVRGPAISLDSGTTWDYLGADHVEYVNTGTGVTDDSFTYDFTAGNLTVRFAIAIPYVKSDLEAFLSRHTANPHLQRSVLATTLGGNPVTLLQVGEPGSGKQAVLLAARAHACEVTASFLLEGFLAEALSDSPAAQEFRSRYVLYCVPILDVDGVEAGDQGKWSPPHDHNRDYGTGNRYPEIAAVQALADAKGVVLAMDIHCPALRGDVHEAFYWDGLRFPRVLDNVDELADWMREEVPRTTRSPLNFMKSVPSTPSTSGLPFAHYFGYREASLLAITLEIPYTQTGSELGPELARDYGAGLLRAWNHTQFVDSSSIGDRDRDGYSGFNNFRSTFNSTYKGSPQQAESLARSFLDDATAPAIYHSEANYLMAVLRLRQRRYTDARTFNQAGQANILATNEQQADALVLQAAIVRQDPSGTLVEMANALAAFAEFENPSDENRYNVSESASFFYEGKGDLTTALVHARAQFEYANYYRRGRTLNRRVANLLDQLNRPAEVIETRLQAVEILRGELFPIQTTGGIFYGSMAEDLLETLLALPDATNAEKTEAAHIILNYQTTTSSGRALANAWLDSLPSLVVALTSPASGATFTAPATITLAATATSSNTSVAKVEFFDGTTKVGEDTVAPYSLMLTDVPVGTYNYRAEASDSAANVEASEIVRVTVSHDGGGPLIGNILFVASDNTPNGSDTQLYNRLIAAGHSVTVVNDDVVATSDAEGKDLIVISATINFNKVTNKFTDTAVPVFTWESLLYRYLGMTGSASEDHGFNAGRLSIDIVNPSHPMAAGLTGTVDLTTSPYTQSWAIPNDNAIVIATKPSESTKAAIFGYETEVPMVGLTAPARRVGFSLVNGGTLGSDGLALFDAGIAWAMGASTSTLPTVTVTAGDPAASELGPNSGTFTVTSSTAAGALTVLYTLGGAATVGSDYAGLPGSVTIDDGASAATVTVSPLADLLAEGPENVSLALVADATYSIGTPASANVEITDLPLDDWKFLHFGGDANTPAIAGDFATPASDGIANLLKYALRIDPLEAGSADLPAPGIHNGRLEIRYSPKGESEGIRVTPEISSTLDEWWNGPEFIEILTDPDTGETIARGITPASGEIFRFIRLRVERITIP